MEIEVKYGVANRDRFRQLLRLRELAGFTLRPADVLRVTDLYLDTAAGRLLEGRYTCRLRTAGDSVVATLKGMGGVEGAVHRRDEREVALPAWSPDVTTWPDGPARDLALKLTGGEPLVTLFELNQERHRADVMAGERCVAQVSLDGVRAVVGRRPAFYYEMEVELTPDGTEAELGRIDEALQGGHGLVPESRSKFERALALLETRGAPVETHLSDAERDALNALATSGDADLVKRATVVLGWADGLPTRELVASSGLSDGRVRFWLRAFRERRMAIFEAVEESAAPADEIPATPAAQPEPEEPAAKARKRKHALPSLSSLLRANGVDLTHARFVAARAVELFTLLRPIHRLGRKRRRLMHDAALLNTIGATQDADRPHRAGRDLILGQPIDGVSTSERLELACIVALGGGKFKPAKEPAMAALDEEQRREATTLAAILQIAEALDFSHTQRTEIVALDGDTLGRWEFSLQGPEAEVDARQASDRSGPWLQLFDQELVFSVAQPAEEPEPAPIIPVVSVDGSEPVAPPEAAPAPDRHVPPAEVKMDPLQGDEPMSEAGRLLILFHFGRMLANEAGTRAGEDIEFLHDMRVSTRRMRAAYQIFEPYFEKDALGRFNKALRRAGGALGAVRDLDVLLKKAEDYQAGLGAEGDGALEPLLESWRARREVARRTMTDLLDSKGYRTFTAEFGEFLNTSGEGARAIIPGEPVPYQVRHVAPRLILERYEIVRAYEAVIDSAPLPTYHLLRIDCKRLRYALEFFKDVLGPEGPALIKQVTAMQDLLGNLQDAGVAEGLIQEFLSGHRVRRKKKGHEAPLAGVEGYLAAQKATQQELLDAFPPPWAEMVGVDFRRALASAVAAM